MTRLKPSSGAYMLLEKLVNLGGRALRKEFAQSGHQALRNKLRTLEARNFVREEGDSLIATVEGKKEMGAREARKLAAMRPAVPVAVAPVRIRIQRPLRANRGVAPYRPGSDEYRSIPSLMGVVRKLPSGEVV
ncbi:hypothetical protein KDM87_06895 [Undibacterium sp. FT147W]|uniref:Uncharacterized protein n=1 Tax=Undibacterium rivi TaxID=2828729 RepID=A0ABS5H0T9_9BURK|nr:hypothetical protein [Undibacterium rivi]MBR7792323.1 hypothetical protein [Undibacterium rivi]